MLALEKQSFDVQGFWRAVLAQDGEAMGAFFREDALVRWHNTGECFTPEEFILANCRYPGRWEGQVERVERLGDLYITVTRVMSADGSLSCHAVSFLRTEGDKLLTLDEYRGDDGPPPEWRRALLLGAAAAERV